MPDDVSIQSLASADRDQMLELDQLAFGFDDRDLDPKQNTAWIEWDRAYGARRGDTDAGIYVVFSYGLSVPAAPPAVATIVPMAGLSWVAVHPDHRRRGLLGAMMRHHLQTVHEAGREPVSCLFASEAGIYGRFGYGLSTECRRLTVPTKTSLRTPHPVDGIVTRVEGARPERHDQVVQQVYDAACRLRPGLTVRPPAQWARHLADPPKRRPEGAEALKILVAERHGAPTGYATFRRSAEWDERGAAGKVEVTDFRALDPGSGHALWRRLLDLDLAAEITTPALPLDDPLVVWAGESGSVGRPGPDLWTRIVDLPAALVARGYATDFDVVVDVSDALCPWNAGRWHLTNEGSGASCRPTSAPADLALDVRELGSAYLGGTTLAGLAAAGLVDELTPGALLRCSAAFRSPVLPATPYMF